MTPMAGRAGRRSSLSRSARMVSVTVPPGMEFHPLSTPGGAPVLGSRVFQPFSVGNEPELLLPTGTQAKIKSADDGSVVAIEDEPVKSLPANEKFSADDEYQRRAAEHSE